MTVISSLRFLAVTLYATTFLYVAQQIVWLSWFHLPVSNTPFYLIQSLCGGLLFFLLGKRTVWHSRSMARAILQYFFPVALLFALGFSASPLFHFLVPLCVGLYVIGVFIYWVDSVRENGTLGSLETHSERFFSLDRFKKKHGAFSLTSVFLGTLFFLFFGLSHLSQFAAVDEPLWMDGRITRFWKNISERDWDKTDISDKPGITIALSSGPGLLFVTPKDYRDSRFVYSAKNPDLDIRDFFLAFRLPLLLVIAFLLPIFYFLLVPLLGKKAALYSYLCIALSPILIGMSKIVNPDSLLWVFAPLSFIAYLVFWEKRRFRALLLSGVFLGLALLTKYVANFLIVFFLGFIFLRYLFIKTNSQSPAEYMKQELTAFGIWLGTGLTVFYLLFPALWLEPKKLLTSTIFSQAFEKIAPLFIIIIVCIFIDQYLFRSRGMTAIMDFGKRLSVFLERFLLLACLLIMLFVLGNGIFGMQWVNFMEILASPKSIYPMSGAVHLYLANFFPLFFGIPVLTLFGILIALIFLWKRKGADTVEKRTILAIIAFILLYSFASVTNEVALINRYQIMLYPLVGIIGGIGLTLFLGSLSGKFSLVKKMEEQYHVFSGLVFGILTYVLLVTPFPLSFSNSLLPGSYTTDIKDMGSGSYEAAQYLNSLPNASEIAIWTDKRGVCKFFVGACADGFDFKMLSTDKIDYVVISAGRESRTERMMRNPYLLNDEGLIRFDTYYEKSDPVWEIQINGRPSQFVKIFPFDTSL